MMKFNGVCLNCSERTVGCHSTCERYKEAKEMYRKETDAFMNHKRSEDDIDAFKTKAITTTKNKYKRR